MSKVKIFLFLQFIFFSALPVLAQVDTAWVRRYNGPENSSDYGSDIAVDRAGNVYVTGASVGTGTVFDYVTIKYSPFGDTFWVRRYNGTGNDFDAANALTVDDSGNVYVTGVSQGSGSLDYATIKYSPSGDTLWVRRFTGTGMPNDLTVDDSGNVYVIGAGDGGGGLEDYATIKYSPSGDTLWVRSYNGPGNSSDFPDGLAVDDSGNVYVTGNSTGSGTSSDYATIKYSPSGDTLWVRRYNGPLGGQEWPRALAVDDSGNVYVTGESQGGDLLQDYATIKYSPSGDTLWVRRYNSPGNNFDVAYALAVDDSENVYVTGGSQDGGFFLDYATIKYSPSGDTLWVRRYNGPGNASDIAYALEVDGSGNVYVTGISAGSGTSSDYATIKYSPSGDTLWVRRYNGPANSVENVTALALDQSGNVYLNGWSEGSGTLEDYATVKYSPCSAKAGDVNGDGNHNLPDIVGEVNIVFKGAPKPNPACRADANADNKITLPDIIMLVNKVFKGGPTPPPVWLCCL